MSSSIDMTTVIFAILAVFVVWKLRAVLGQRTGAERPPEATRREGFKQDGAREEVGRPSTPANEDGVIRMSELRERARFEDPDRWRPYAEAGSPVAAGLDAIARRDPSFDVKSFVDGAKQAYEMIVTAFAAGDRRTLQPLLAKDVYDGFAGAISEREKNKRTVEQTFVSIDDVAVADAALRGPTAEVTLRLHSKLINATRDAAGAVVDGAPDKIVDVYDQWTFARDVTSRDPNWRLVATQNPA
jgi:predicted lipid-binding transport protein (Tim44 family)